MRLASTALAGLDYANDDGWSGARHAARDADCWLSSDDLARLADVSGQMARKAIAARHWRGADLVVRAQHSGRGQGGKSLMVHIDSLPATIRARYWAQAGVDINARPALPVHANAQSTALDAAAPLPFAAPGGNALAMARLNAIRPILAQPSGSAARTSAIQWLAANGFSDPSGKLVHPGKVTIYGWLKAYQTAGLAGLAGKRRRDKGSSRCMVSRAWDAYFTQLLDEAAITSVSDALSRYIRSRWASGAPGWRMISEHATSHLHELTTSACAAMNIADFAGLPVGRLGDMPSARRLTQYGLCQVGRRRVEAERSYALIHVKRADNALYQDKYAASIRRDYASLAPRDIVVGDVHPVDIMMRRDDGSTVFPKAISWFDPATNEIHMTFVLCAKGEGIRREHVAQAFEAMVEEWGLPRLLYLDNGSEYKWAEMMGGFTLLSKLVGSLAVHDLGTDSLVNERVKDARTSVVRSLAYNARGKPGIEGAFGNLERLFFSQIAGWTAGDRMNKKTHAKGRDPVAFAGDASAFLAQAAIVLEGYHKRVQHGRLAGRSPNDTLRAAIDRGWGKVAVKPGILPLAFAQDIDRTVTHGTIEYTPPRGVATRYYHDELLALTGQKVRVKICPYDPQYAWIFNQHDALICAATPEARYHPLDSAGAAERQRRNQWIKRHIADRKRHCALLDPVAEIARHNSHLPDAPDVPVLAEVDADVLSRMLERSQIEARAELEGREAEPQRQLSQWQRAANPLLDNFTFAEEDE